MPFVYRPLAQRAEFAPAGSALHVRTATPARRMVEQVQRELNQLGGGTTVTTVTSLADLIAPQLLPWRIATTLFGALGLLGLVLASVGLYGVMSYVVTLRTRELGVRIAVGATPQRILAMVVTRALYLVAAGLVLGAVAAVFASRVVRGLVYGVSTTDPMSFVLAAAVLVGTALVAALVPARRAARIDPVEALRFE
jgi:ABC-type antimicrobial peptide transport system permease subunit